MPLRTRARLASVLVVSLGVLAFPVDSPAVFASPINGGCYIVGANDCRIHVEPVLINVASGQRLEAAQIWANGIVVYDFRTDVSNPPPDDYTISIPAQDFGARCGETYTVNITGRDSGDTNFLNMGQTESFTCPSTVP